MNINEIVEKVWQTLCPLFRVGFNKKRDEDRFISDFARAIEKKLKFPKEGNNVEMIYTGGRKVECKYKFLFKVAGDKAILVFKNMEQELPGRKNLPLGIYRVVEKTKAKGEEVFYNESKSEEGWPIHRTEIQWSISK